MPDPTLFVVGFSPETTQADVQEYFNKAGKVTRVFRKNSFAFISFERLKYAQRAIEKFNGKKFNDGKRLSVQMSRDNKKGKDGNQRGKDYGQMKKDFSDNLKCFNCNQSGHMKFACPELGKKIDHPNSRKWRKKIASESRQSSFESKRNSKSKRKSRRNHSYDSESESSYYSKRRSYSSSQSRSYRSSSVQSSSSSQRRHKKHKKHHSKSKHKKQKKQKKDKKEKKGKKQSSKHKQKKNQKETKKKKSPYYTDSSSYYSDSFQKSRSKTLKPYHSNPYKPCQSKKQSRHTNPYRQRDSRVIKVQSRVEKADSQTKSRNPKSLNSSIQSQ